MFINCTCGNMSFPNCNENCPLYTHYKFLECMHDNLVENSDYAIFLITKSNNRYRLIREPFFICKNNILMFDIIGFKGREAITLSISEIQSFNFLEIDPSLIK